MLEHPIIAKVIAGVILLVIAPIGGWFLRKVFRPEIHIETTIEKGPTTRELGFTEPAVKITLVNNSTKDIQIRDIRLIFCRHFGASIVPEAPPGRSHHQLPLTLPSGKEDSSVRRTAGSFRPNGSPGCSVAYTARRTWLELSRQRRDSTPDV